MYCIRPLLLYANTSYDVIFHLICACNIKHVHVHTVRHNVICIALYFLFFENAIRLWFGLGANGHLQVLINIV